MSASCGLKVVGVVGACGEMFDVKLAGNVAGFCEIQWGDVTALPGRQWDSDTGAGGPVGVESGRVLYRS